MVTADGEPADRHPIALDTRALDLVVQLGAILLAAGAPTEDVEAAMRRAAVGAGIDRPSAVVTFNAIALSALPAGSSQPTTALRLVPERRTDFGHLAATTRVAGQLGRRELDIEAAVTEIDRIAALGHGWPLQVRRLAPAGSAAAAALLLGASWLEALVTGVIGILVQPLVAILERSALTPFFRSLLGPFASALLVVVTVALGAAVDPVFVLAGSLLRFLPGSGVVAGIRDLIDGSVVSGSARLVEAFFLASGVAAGAALGMGASGEMAVVLGADSPRLAQTSLPLQVVAAAVACACWAIVVDVPRWAIASVAVLGGIAWGADLATAAAGASPIAATAVAGLLLGALGRILAERAQAPVVVWVVPASLPILPGLQIVNGLLTADQSAGLVYLAGAGASALGLGASVALGDIAVRTARRIAQTHPRSGL